MRPLPLVRANSGAPEIDGLDDGVRGGINDAGAGALAVEGEHLMAEWIVQDCIRFHADVDVGDHRPRGQIEDLDPIGLADANESAP